MTLFEISSHVYLFKSANWLSIVFVAIFLLRQTSDLAVKTIEILIVLLMSESVTHTV